MDSENTQIGTDNNKLILVLVVLALCIVAIFSGYLTNGSENIIETKNDLSIQVDDEVSKPLTQEELIASMEALESAEAELVGDSDEGEIVLSDPNNLEEWKIQIEEQSGSLEPADEGEEIVLTDPGDLEAWKEAIEEAESRKQISE